MLNIALWNVAEEFHKAKGKNLYATYPKVK